MAFFKFNRRKKKIFLTDVTAQQLREISLAADDHASSEAERKADRDLTLTLASLGIAIIGTVFHSPLVLLSLPWFVVSSIPIFKDAYRTLSKGQVGVDTLSSIVILTCTVNRYYIVANLSNTVYYLSRKLLQKVKKRSRKAVIDVFQQQPHSVWVSVNGIETEIPVAQLAVGDVVVVNAGGMIPVDGTITEGIASIDQHILTGESQPVEKEIGEQVFASTTVLAGRICIAVEKAGEETVVARIGQILNNTAEFKPATQLRAEILTDRTIVPTLALSGLSLPFVGPAGAVAILNAHYKYKMGMVAPISVLAYLSLMSHHQILIKEGKTLDLLNQVDTIVFDKTGTLTEEQPYVATVHLYAECDENTVLTYAASAEYTQKHPIARAILQEAKSRQLALLAVDEAEYKVGYGLAVTINGALIRVGSTRFMAMEGITISTEIQTACDSCHRQGHVVVLVAMDCQVIGALEICPTIRPEAKQMIHSLRKEHGIKSMYIISGDHKIPTEKLARELGIEHYFAETLPEHKANLIEQLQQQGKFVCYIGDGINDAIALKKAQVSISLRGASTVATDTAQIILIDGQLHQLTKLFSLAREFETNVNIGFMTLLTPTIIGMAGVFFWHFGLTTTLMLSYGGLLIGILNSSLPLFNYQRRNLIHEQRETKEQLPLLPNR